jgi:hypothetical protein
MQKRVVLVSAAVAVLGLAAAALGFVAESTKSKASYALHHPPHLCSSNLSSAAGSLFVVVYFHWSAAQAFVGFVGQRCVYQRTPALGCGVAAALLALTGLATATAASGCLRRRDAPAAGRRRAVAVKLSIIAWYVRAY